MRDDNMRPSTMLVVLILLLQTICGADITDPSTVSEISLKITQEGTVETPLFRLNKINVELIMPQKDENQDVDFKGELTRDRFGNTWIHMEERNPPRIFHYIQEYHVNVTEKKTTTIPIEYEIPDDVKIYLKATENIQSNNSVILELAEEITKNSKNDLERITRLAKWVHDHIEYRKKLGNESKDAIWTLENKAGTCDEYSTLYIALTRAIGIPARFIAGYSYGSDRWEEHAFTEVYLGEWIPVDPTNLDVCRLDAAHIKFAVSNDNLIGSKIKAYGNRAEEIEWKSKTDIRILDYKQGRKPDYELEISSDKLYAGENAVAIFKITSNEYTFLRAAMQPCVSNFPFIEIDELEKDVILEPNREKIMAWKIKVSENLEENMQYTCPLVLNSKNLELKEVVVNVNTQKQRTEDKIELKAELSDPILGYGRNQTIYLHIKNLRYSKPVKIGVVSGNYLKEFHIDSEEHTSISFKPEQLGRQEIIVYSSTGTVSTLDYTVKEMEEVYIDKIEMPSVIKKGDEEEIKLWIRNNRTTPQELKLYIDLGDKEIIKSLSMENTSIEEIPFKMNEPGIKKIKFRLTGIEVDSETLREITVYDVPDVKVDALYIPHKKKASVTLKVSKDKARNIEVEINGEKKSIPELVGEDTVEFNIDVENPEVTVSYEDPSGEEYSIKKSLKVKEEGLVEKIIRTIGEFIQSLLDSFSLS